MMSNTKSRQQNKNNTNSTKAHAAPPGRRRRRKTATAVHRTAAATTTAATVAALLVALRSACGAFGLTLCTALLLFRSAPTAYGLAVGVDTTNANLTDLGGGGGSPATVQPQLIPHGSQQLYEFINKVSMTELKVGSKGPETSYTFKSLLKVNSVWHSERGQLLQLYFSESTVSAPDKTGDQLITQKINKIPDRPVYISLIDGKPSKVIAHTSRDQSLLNLERGIASLLQLQYGIGGPVKEVDVSGQCNAFYDVKSTTKIEKTKLDCSHWDLRVTYRQEKPLSVSQHSQEHIHYDLSADGALLRVSSTETHRVALEAKPDVGSQVTSLISLQHTGVGEEGVEQLSHSTLTEAIKSLLEWYRVFDIEADVDGAISEIMGSSLKEELAAHAEQLSDEYVGSQKLAAMFAKLLPLARITKQEEFVEILQTHKNLHGHLVDLMAAVQTIDAHNAINEVFKYEDEDAVDFQEKYLQSLAVGTHPELTIMQDLLQRLQSVEDPIENERLRDNVVQTLASLMKQASFDSNDPLLKEVRQYLLQQLSDHCEDMVCRTVFIRALQNLQDAATIPILITNAVAGDAKVSVAAMQALQSFPTFYLNETLRKAVSEIFFQIKRKYDSSVRTLALDILLAMKPSKQQLGELLDYLQSNDRQFEIKTYLIQKLRMLAEKCSKFESLLAVCLAERPKVNNYDVIAQKGLTTVLSRQLYQTPAFNESLLSVQEIYQGVLKRGSVDLVLSTGREETSTFKLGIYTSGLNSFVSDSDEEVDEADTDQLTATAGMEITVQGVLLRPLVFFTGQSELMGHVWSGTASEPTPAYQATTLAQDHEHYMILSSGATVYLRVIGSKSIDLSGKVELSLWNRNANTEIQQNSGTAVVGIMIAGFTYARVENEFTVASEPKISLQAEIDFYSNVKLCIQLQCQEMILTHNNTRSVLLSASQPYVKRVRTKSTHILPGRTLALNQKNNEMCNQILD